MNYTDIYLGRLVSGKVRMDGSCRKNSIHASYSQALVKDDESPPHPKNHVRAWCHSIKKKTFLCGEVTMSDTKHPNRKLVLEVLTIPFCNTIMSHCLVRGDDWASEVERTIHGWVDLITAKARHHRSCYFEFTHDMNSVNTLIRYPEHDGKLAWFEVLCNWLENESEVKLYSLSELHAHVADMAGNAEVYSIKRLKQKLEEHYSE